VKRAVLGPAIPTHRLIHERLGKVTALPIFSSDALSSVAYATEEMLRVLVIAGVGAVMFSLVFPISIAIAVILITLVFSYRQTIKAYPSAGGAYIVTKDNFGLLPAQVAGVALLTDYVLTVAVSISAGVAAIVTAATGLYPYRVPIALFFLAVLMWGNLRGVRESGKMFALPTYLFILGIATMLLVGFVRVTFGELTPLPTTDLAPAPADAGLLLGVSLFIVLKAMSSGSAALTGVEAISNGVPAFKPPEWRNARATLMIMGAILGTMFLGISFLVATLHVAPDMTDRKTVLGMLAQYIFGSGSFGHAAFLYIQIATMAILVLAANTSFADFPRLANFHAGDAFMPRQFTSRGHRLVFSNGIIALGAAAGFLIVLFQANVTRLIPFYALGVFTSFTMSQAGMAKRHLRLREPGWRHGFAINAFGAVMTGVVDVVIMVTKFPDDLAIIVLVPVLVLLLVRMNRAYEHEREQLDEDLSRFDARDIQRPTIVLVVEDMDRRTMHALQYASTIGARDVHAVHFAHGETEAADLVGRWNDLAISVPLELVTHRGDLPEALAWYVDALPAEADVNVVLASPVEMPFLRRLRRRRSTTQITRALLPYERVRVTLVRDHLGPGHTIIDTGEGPRIRFTPRSSHLVVVLVERADRASLRAVRYAMSLGGTDVRAVHAAVDLENQERLIRAWMELSVPVQLDVIECWDRNVARTLEGYVVGLMGKGREVTAVLARRDYPHALQRLLHDRTSRKIVGALSRYEHVDVAVVPYFLGATAQGTTEGHPRTPASGPPASVAPIADGHETSADDRTPALS
jgi:amino acid transporter